MDSDIISLDRTFYGHTMFLDTIKNIEFMPKSYSAKAMVHETNKTSDIEGTSVSVFAVFFLSFMQDLNFLVMIF
jgi:hypothetical protein